MKTVAALGFFEKLSLSILGLLVLLIPCLLLMGTASHPVLPMQHAGTPSSPAPAADVDRHLVQGAAPVGEVPGSSVALAAGNDRIGSALETLKERASAQQTLVTSLATLTGIYVVVLSIAAYLRLQQSKDDFDAIDRRFEEGKLRIDRLIAEVRTDVPAVHGIGRKLERLLSELDERLPVDGDWTDRRTYAKLGPEQIQQALIDEMVINSLEIFNLRADAGVQRTISRLYVRVGQFYFARAAYLREHERKAGHPSSFEPANLDCAIGCLKRAIVYFTHAIVVDERDPIALRAAAVALTHEAIWIRIDSGAPALETARTAHAMSLYNRSLQQDETEPGACLGKSYLMRHAARPYIAEAIDLLSNPIAKREELSPRQRRKFLSAIYLNRASYRTLVLQGKPHPGAPANAARLDEILDDLREGLREASAAADPEAFRASFREELREGGDLYFVYTERTAEIDALLST